jgi:hypothetical protein
MTDPVQKNRKFENYTEAEKAQQFDITRDLQREASRIAQFNKYNNDLKARAEKLANNKLYKLKTKYTQMGYTFAKGKVGLEEVKVLIDSINEEPDERVKEKQELLKQKKNEVNNLIKEIYELKLQNQNKK